MRTAALSRIRWQDSRRPTSLKGRGRFAPGGDHGELDTLEYPATGSQIAFARVATALAALSVGALAVGALAIGALRIGRLALGTGTIKRLSIEDLEVGRLRVREPAAPQAPV